MWVEALDLLLARLRENGPDPISIRAIAGSAQQHGSVYLNASAARTLKQLDPETAAHLQLAACLSRDTSPIWQDSSTTDECAEIRDRLGGVEGAVRTTGSDIFERFTGPQIRRFSKRSPDAYEATEAITLISGFLASVLSGGPAPLEPGDAAGMSVMDIRKLSWHPAAVAATAPDLCRRLPPICPSDRAIGPIAKYFVENYGFAAETLVLPWSGDNPSSLVGLGLVRKGMVGLSLGTSDTYFACVDEPAVDPRGEGHVFGSPTGAWMTLNCFRNGSLAREAIRDQHGLDWASFSAALRSTPPGNGGRLLLPWMEPEIVPRTTEPGFIRGPGLDLGDADGNCRGVIEGQALAMRLHASWMGQRPVAIRATGGASDNDAILQVLADVFACPIARLETPNGAALGAALRAAHGYWLNEDRARSWSDVVAPFTASPAGATISPDEKAAGAYDELLPQYAALEKDNL